MVARFGPRGIVSYSLLATALLLPACLVRQAPDPLIAAELHAAREENAAERVRVARLEARIQELEVEANAREERDHSDGQRLERAREAHDNRRILQRLDELLIVNQRLLEEAEIARRRAEAAERVHASLGERDGASDTDLPSVASHEERLRQIVYEMHGKPGRWRGGLSLEQSEALRILLKAERNLDADNPWSDAP